MEMSVVISITFNGGDNFIDHFKILYDITWADLEAMVKTFRFFTISCFSFFLDIVRLN